MSESRPKRAETKTGVRRRNYLSAIDAGFRWTAAHRKVELEVKSEDVWRYAGGINSAGYGWSMFRSASKYRHFWQAGGDNGYSIHLTPHGTYFRLNGNSNERHLSGGYLRADGTLGTFDGRHNYPLYCVGCGRTDLRVTESSDCAKEIYVPAELLINIPEYLGFSPATIAQREEREWRQKSRTLELEKMAKIKKAAEPPPAPVPVPRPAPVRQRPIGKPGPMEVLLISVLGSLWGTLKFLLVIILIGLAAGRR
jgi:hypothetical protein